jgi:hypothetical protein
MCQGCFGDEWDQFLDALSTTFDQLVPVIRGIAMAISYIPVFGTGVSFLLNAGITLAQGGNLEKAVLDGVGAALPGQPASGVAFNAARSLAKGDRVDRVAIAALPLDPSVKEVVSVAMDIAVAVAQRQDLGEAALEQLYARLPDEGKQAVDLARRAARGEAVEDELLRRGIELARERGGEAAVNRYIAESGFQASVDTLDIDLQIGLRSGLVVGGAEQHQYIGPLFDPAEKNSEALNRHAARGREIIDTGVVWFGRTVSDIRASSAFTFTRQVVDPFTNVLGPHTIRHEITDRWRRGFDVAWGACEGKDQHDQEQDLVRQWLAHTYAQQAFDVGQAMQHYRTWAVIRGEAEPEALRHVQMAPRPAPDQIRGTAERDREVFDRLERAENRRDGQIEGTANRRAPAVRGLAPRRQRADEQIQGTARDTLAGQIQAVGEAAGERFLYREGRFR